MTVQPDEMALANMVKSTAYLIKATDPDIPCLMRWQSSDTSLRTLSGRRDSRSIRPLHGQITPRRVALQASA